MARLGRGSSRGSHDGFGLDETVLDAVGLPAIPVSAGALIFDRAGWLLILKPTYKSGWTIPGGVMEGGGETPWDACRREVAEECGLHTGAGHPARLACMDFRRPRPGEPVASRAATAPHAQTHPSRASTSAGIRCRPSSWLDL
jgi:ADP-ribose pyrophosphatase YjhB (NUDIX family)